MARPENKSRFAEPENFLGFETGLDFSRPIFSEIRLQIKRLQVFSWVAYILVIQLWASPKGKPFILHVSYRIIYRE